MPTQFLTGPAAASGVALVATIASIGGFLGPALIGYLKNRTQTHTTAFVLLGFAALVAGFLSLRLRSSSALTGSALTAGAIRRPFRHPER